MKRYLVTTVSALSLLAATAFSAQAGVGSDVFATTTVEWTTTQGSAWTMTSTPGTGVIGVDGNSLDPASMKSPVIRVTNKGFPAKFVLIPNKLHAKNSDYWMFGDALAASPKGLIKVSGGHASQVVMNTGQSIDIEFAANSSLSTKLPIGKQSAKVELRVYTD